MDEYEITYWCGVNNDQGEFVTKTVKIEKWFVSQLFTDKPLRFLPFVDEDEHKIVVSTENICQIKEV
ncbi:hypothetical protein [Ligilactobacillus acidipiscis]|uniref:Uncharacterized protein n=1 Tax=Ligilactobacillus acidipiscis TaxID=89059 RepID=A0A921F6P0_9LACO|nr:hypothetical protein [Ligilactobacillus acidipiscis]HJE96329.1 hypothetical protein [Ligilactobacillus acidipiscis]